MTVLAEWTRRGLAGLLVLVSLLLLAAASRFPWQAEPDGRALLRLSWRVRGEQVTECRRLTDAEQQALPAHMRREQICEGRVAPYRLTLEIDDRLVTERVVRAGGAREDRPVFVFAEYGLEPGEHDIHVTFERATVTDTTSTGEDAVPARLDLGAVLDLDSADVALVTYDAVARELVLRTPSQRPED